MNRYIIVAAVCLGLSCAGARAAEPKDTRLKELLKERLAALKLVAAAATAQRKIDPAFNLNQLIEANQAVHQAELELCETDKDRIAVLEKALLEAKEMEKAVERLVEAGQAAVWEPQKAKAARLAVEIALERAKVK
jgi:hypothetical protein